MDKQNPTGRSDYHGRFGDGTHSSRPTGSFRTPPSGTYRSREDYHARHSEPGKIDRPFTWRIEQEARLAAEQPAPEEKKKKPKREKKKRMRDPEKRIITRKRVFIGIAAILALAIAAILIFGEHGTHHDMPVITPPEDAEESIGG